MGLTRSCCNGCFAFCCLTVGSCTAVIKMEGGTDFDLQVLEVPQAPAAAGADASRVAAGAGAGERSQEDRVGGSRSAPTNSEAKGSQAVEAGAAAAASRDRKDSKRVRVYRRPTPAPDWTTVGHMLFFFRRTLPDRMERAGMKRRKRKK